MQTVSAAFLIVLSLATQSFAAPLDIPRNLASYASEVDTFISTQTYDDGLYHPWTASVASTTSTSSPNAPISTYAGPSGYGGHHNQNGTTILPSGTGFGTGLPGPSVTSSPPTSTGTGPKHTTSSVSSSSISPSSTATAAAPTKTVEFSHGNGADWPTIDKWVSFDTLWASYLPSIEKAGPELKNSTGYDPPINSADETAMLKDAIQSVAKAQSVDERYVLATVIQESHGCVHVGSTYAKDGSVFNPGLMQDHNGLHSCDSFKAGTCPKDQIVGMITDGTAGTNSAPGGGDGLKQVLAQAVKEGAKDGSAQSVYWAAKIYNSGSFDPSKDDLQSSPGATSTYANDIANRLTGVVF